jgi:hypothetical protein
MDNMDTSTTWCRISDPVFSEAGTALTHRQDTLNTGETYRFQAYSDAEPR